MKKFMYSLSAALMPVVAFAQGTNTNLDTLFTKIKQFIGYLFPIAVAIAVLVFFYEIIMFIYNKDDAGKKEIAKAGIWKSLLALAIMLTFFGLIQIVANTLGVEVGTGIKTENIPTVEL